MQAALDVEAARDAQAEELPPGGRKASTGRGYADERGCGLERECLVDRADDREPVLGPRPPRVEDRDDVVRAVADDPRAVLPWCGSPEKPSARISSLRRLDAESGPLRGSLDTAREFNTGPRVAGEQEVAVEVDVVEEARDLRPGCD